MKNRILSLCVALLAVSCTADSARIDTFPFGRTADGQEVTKYRLTSPLGSYIEVLDYGGHIVGIYVPDRNGVIGDVALGYDTVDEYENPDNKLYIGALLGRYANRIETGVVEIDGRQAVLSPNETVKGHVNHIHGGYEGFNHKMWHAEPSIEGRTAVLTLTRISPDGEEGYPGNLACKVTYKWTPENVWRIEYEAVTDRPTIVNMSQHCFFNLDGYGASVMDHTFMVDADSYSLNSEWYIPESRESVEGTPFDFREPRVIGERADMPSLQLERMGGYSAGWYLNGYDGTLRKVAKLSGAASGRTVEVSTTEPCLLIYTGRWLSESVRGKYGALYPYAGMILETIHHPNTPRNPELPQCTLRPNEKYRSVTEYRFGIAD